MRVLADGDHRILEGDTPYLRFRVVDGVAEVWEVKQPHAVVEQASALSKPGGLGDTITRVTALLRLDRLARATARLLGLESCGCERRRQWLNRMVPYAAGAPPRDDSNPVR